MNRNTMWNKLAERVSPWDIAIVGGGATGLGIAVDAASRGFSVVLFEQTDFAKATSSRSTKLIHGGLRYLQQGNIGLVVEALHERGLLTTNAPHLVHPLPFLVPTYHWWEGPFYGIGIKLYDLLAGNLGLHPSRHLNRRQALRAVPTLEKKGLSGAMLYYDGQFDDARLAMTLALTAADHGALLVNYAKVTSLKKQKGLVTGLHVTNLETHKSHTISARVVINATGIFADHLRKLDTSRAPPMMVPSQGVHLVLGPEFLRGDTAILVPHTDDGRVIFLVPWEGKVLIGTTDTPVKKTSLEPIPLKSEVEFLLETAGRYLAKAPTENDILSLFAGLRPLVRSSSTKGTSEIARDHAITISKSGLLTIAGGKWTTYRKMAEDAVGRAIRLGHLPARPCMTETLKLHGYLAKVDPHDPLSVYGSRAKEIRSLQRKSAFLRKKIHPRLPYTYAQLRFAVREEMARTVDDLLARRTRALLLDAAAAIESAPPVAAFLRRELKQSRRWMEQQIREFQRLAENYLYL